MALVAPFFAYLEQLRELQGEPLVTYAEGNQAFPVTERVAKVFRTIAKEYRMLDPEPDIERFPGLVCTEIKELRGDRNMVEVYRKWEGLPGPLISDDITDSSSGTNGHEIRQRVSADTPPYPVGAFRVLSLVDGEVTVESEHHFPDDPLTVYLAGAFPSTPVDGSVADGYFTATRTGPFTFHLSTRATPPVPITASAQPKTGWVSTVLNVAKEGEPEDLEIVISSKMTEDNDVAGTLVTITAELPGMRTHSLVWTAAGLRKIRSERTVIPGTQLDAFNIIATGPGPGFVPEYKGENYEEESITPLDTSKSRHVVEVLVDSHGIPLGFGLGEYTIAARDGKVRFTAYTTWRIVAANTEPPVEGETFVTAAAGQGIVLESKTSPIQGSPNVLLEVEWYKDLPPPRVEFPATSFSFPGVLTVLQDWWNNSDTPGALRRPYMGIDVDYIDPKQLRVTGREVVFYGEGARGTGYSGYLPKPFSVISPASGSRAYPFCRPNTIHDKVIAYARTAMGDFVLTENLEASTPSTYDPQAILVADASAQQWRGRIYEFRIMQVSEFLPAFFFPTLYIEVPFNCADAPNRTDLIFSVKNLGFPKGAPLVAKSTAAGILGGGDDRGMEITINGRTREQRPGKHFEFTAEDMFLNATDATLPVQTFYNWVNLYEIKLSRNPVGTITLSAPASFVFGSIRVKPAPDFLLDGHTLKIRHKIQGSGTWQTRVYTFKNTEGSELTCDTKSTLAAGDYLTIANNDGLVHFWFDVTGLVLTTPPAIAALGGIAHRVDVSDPSVISAADTYDALIQHIDGFLLSSGVKAWTVLATVGIAGASIYDNFHGARTAISINIASALVSSFWEGNRIALGTAAAPNQIRIDYGARTQVGDVIVTDVNLTARNIFNTLADVNTALDAGQCAPLTDPLPFQESTQFSLELDTVTVGDADTFNAVWDITQTVGASLAIIQPQPVGEDTTVATFLPGPPAQNDAYRAINFYNPYLATANVPATLIAESAGIHVGGAPCYIEARADGTPAVVVAYQTGPTKDGPWHPGVHAAMNLVNGITHRKNINPDEETAAHPLDPAAWVRIAFDNSASASSRAVHCTLWIDVED